MPAVRRPIRSWLYAPGNNPKLLAKVFEAGADAVVLDLEDAVPASEKESARRLVAAAVEARAGRTNPSVYVRVNHPETGLTQAEVEAVVRPGLSGIRLPKTEDADTVRRMSDWIDAAEARSGLHSGSVEVVCNVESARGVYAALSIATAAARVRGLAFGAADFTRDLGLTVGADERETLYARSALVLASRVANVESPVDSVYTRLQDDEGLEQSTRRGSALGFFGRSAIHPRQVAIIHAVYTPAEDEIARARLVVDAAARAETRGSGAIQLENGDFVDVAIVRRAEGILRLADLLQTPALAGEGTRNDGD